jgi:hypothetical protein
MSREDPLWGAPRIHGELLKLGYEISQATVAKYMSKRRRLTQAFPFDTAPRFLIRDRDAIYGAKVVDTLRSIGVEEAVTARKSPWQNGYVERVIGSVRRECLDHVIVLNQRHLRRILKEYFEYYHEARTHLGLGKDSPVPREVERPSAGADVVAEPMVGGLHHRYYRRAA